MGETLASLLPWQARTRRARYLSFLPLNHVVEGILVAYAGYYIPEPVDIYFLEDFRQVQRYLPQVRPTFFFSVPRVFEKAWESLEESRPGRFYLGLPAGPLKSVLRSLLRWSVLGKLGLGAAAQLTVGSAVAGEALLLNFRELGIEIHNAYGLTEAPLVTLNRAGANHIGTVGTPLPRTQVRIAEDGEVLVQGPQVTAGYFEAGPGFAGPGRLAAYGRPGAPDRGRLPGPGGTQEGVVQDLVRQVCPAGQGRVAAARHPRHRRDHAGGGGPPVLRGAAVDNRPRPCSHRVAIAQAIWELSRGLSHPEQVKRWAVLRNDLSLERGDLTANLKLKRQTVAARLQGLIEALYAESPAAAALGSLCDGFLFAGEAARN